MCDTIEIDSNNKRKENAMKPEELFNKDNTVWETDIDSEGNVSKHLVYVGSLEELAGENNISVDKVYELLGEYEDMSLDLIEYEEEIRQDYKSLIERR